MMRARKALPFALEYRVELGGPRDHVHDAAHRVKDEDE
jgi:hypothetical protein